LIEKTYNQLLQEQISRYPHKDFIISKPEDIKWTYAEAARQQDALASGIAESGGKGPFATALPLRVETVIAQIATARANVSFVPLEPGAKAKRLTEQLEAVNPGTLVWPAKVHKTVQLDEIYEVFPHFNERSNKEIRINDQRFPNLRQVLQTSKQDLDGMYMFRDFLVYHNPLPLKQAESKINTKEAKVYILTPNNKEVGVSEHAILNAGYLVGLAAELNEEDRICTTLGLHRAAGLSLGVGLALSHKAALLWGSEVFDAAKVLEVVSLDKATVLVANVNELKDLTAAQSSKVNTSSLRTIIAVASPLNRPDPTVLSETRSRLNVNIVVVFGVDETAGVLSVSKPNDFTSLGSALPQTQLSVVDGNLQVTGFNVSAGYVNDASLTKARFVNGAFNTGLKAKLEGGNLTLI
jgi:fatty-acyl-CoA synthase